MNLLERIDRWAEVSPGAIAHVSDERTLDYGELRRRSDALAGYLTERFGDDRAPIAVLGHREPELLIAFLGVVKSGRAYVPLDTALPQQRIEKILATARAKLVLTPEEIAQFSATSRHIPTQGVQNGDPFYILFTSGSTGEPKGVVITLGCLEHFLSWMLAEQKFVGLGETFLNQAPFSFDLSVMDLYCSLATGGTLFSIGRDLVANPKMLYRALAKSGVTTWISTPSFAQLCLAEDKFNQTMLPQVRRFLFCGETLAPQTAGSLLQRFPKAEVWNTYGPTEATVATTSVRIDDALLKQYASLPVGRTMPGTQIFLTGENGKCGEIIIAGPNVSPGYIGRDAPGPFFLHHGQQAYRTGDRGRFADDLLFFEGRIDQQIKLNGHRIELGDVEANLRQLDRVRDAAVIPVRKNGVLYSLAAFVVLCERSEASDFELTRGLRKSLGERLPAYMLPRRILFLDKLPMTANGKVDRSKLAESL